MNVLLITADDLNWNSLGSYGCTTPDPSPNLDRLAGEGIRFDRAHVTIAVCQPSRGAIMTGCYPHRSGLEGFHSLPAHRDILPVLLRRAGYHCGILGKVGHSTPDTDFDWDYSQDMPDLDRGRDAELYYRFISEFLKGASDAERPFFMMANSHDPHRPFYGSDQEARNWPGEPTPAPSRVYAPEEVEVPGFLPDIPEVRFEMAEYHSSVRRCDDTVGRLLDALDDADVADDTVVIFLSDNGMAFPFAKTNCYLHSTKTPLIVRAPGVCSGGRVDSDHFVNGIDLFTTILELCGVEVPDDVDGRSITGLLAGEAEAGRERIFTEFHETAGRLRYPMRCVQDERYGYILNPWSDGETEFRNESQSGRSFKAMSEAGREDPAIADRVKLFSFRVPAELYDLIDDPDCIENLIDQPEHRDRRDSLHAELHSWMRDTQDTALPWMDRFGDDDARSQFMSDQYDRANALRSTAKQSL